MAKPTPNSMYIHFKENVARTLQKPPYNWVGRVGYELVEKYSDVIETFWPNNAPVEAVAEFINDRHMEESQRKQEEAAKRGFYPTRKDLEAIGIKFRTVKLGDKI